ncbi:MAG TPA: MmpS family transport accessory protein [Mycobacterium sp.]|nr:MmpS family transport accessory protein [Mycobacterium sp.]
MTTHLRQVARPERTRRPSPPATDRHAPARGTTHPSHHTYTISIISTTNHFGSDVVDYPDDDIYADVDDHADAPDRWRPVALVAAGVLVLAVIATALIVNGGDSTSTSATVGPAPSRSVIASPRPPRPTALPPSTPLPRETITTVPPPSSALPTTTPFPTVQQTPPSSLPVLNPRTVIYRVTGTKQLLDFVSVVYTDAHGLPHTDFNVSLPWSKMIVLEPGVQVESVIATSLGGHLNCAVTNAVGQTVVASTNNAMIATCAH